MEGFFPDALFHDFAAVDVLNDLLNYDKIEQGNLQLQLKVISGFQLVEKVIHEFGLSAMSKNIRLGLSFVVKNPDNDSVRADNTPLKHSIDLPANVQKLCIAGDPVRLTQVLRNLMSNAMKFTPEQGSIHVKVVFDQSQKETHPSRFPYARTLPSTWSIKDC